MAQKFLTNVSGQITEIEATVTSAGAGDAGKIPALDSTGKLDVSAMPTSIGTPTVTLTTSEDLTEGDFVNIYDNAGTATARKADSTDGTKKAVGFVVAGSTSGSNAVVYLQGQNTHLTGLTVGSKYWLSTSGAAVATAPSGTGKSLQLLGIAYSTTAIQFELHDNIILA